MSLIREIESEHLRMDLPDFRSGDNIKVHLRIIEGEKIIAISNFENYNEVLWYDKLLTTEPALTESVMAKIASRIYISNDNLSLVTLLSLKEYNQFFKQNFK